MDEAGSMHTRARLDTTLRRLHELGIVTPEQVDLAKREQQQRQERFGVILARLGIIRSPESGKSLMTQLGWLPSPIDSSQRTGPVPAVIPPDICRAHRLAPLQRTAAGSLVLATDDPLTIFALDWLERRLQTSVEFVLVTERDLNSLLAQVEEPTALVPASMAPKAAAAPFSPPAAAKEPPVTKEPPPTKEPAVTKEDEPVIRLVDSLLREAVQLRASDIHVEPLADRLKIRYRIDGVLREMTSPSKGLQGPVTSRIKIMAGLNIAEKRLPQDGRLQIDVDGHALDIRLSTLPSLHGESLVMRLLDRRQAVHGLSELGMSPEDQQRWEQLIRRPNGMILVTGPTGSGKTTTLYATLATLNRPDHKLITLEDPVEYQLPGVNQVQVKSAIGFTFASGLRAMLRQAPDVIMVGEIRDQETAQIAIQAALTGHLVFSTLHTNDAPSAVTRLIDMGVAPFLVASTVQGVMAQRLVRRICPACQVKRPPTPEEQIVLGEIVDAKTTVVAAAFGVTQVTEGKGCDQCQQTGYLGRIAIYELLLLSEALRHHVVAKTSAQVLKQRAVQESMRTLRQDGCLKVQQGLTTVAEVLRATPNEPLTRTSR